VQTPLRRIECLETTPQEGVELNAIKELKVRKKQEQQAYKPLAEKIRAMVAEACGCTTDEAAEVLQLIAGNAVIARIAALPRLDLAPEKYIAEVAAMTAEGVIPSDVSRTLLYAAQLALASMPRDVTPRRDPELLR
jgi:hypothetical protein